METLGHSGYLAEHFEIITESPINYESWDRKLQRNGVSSQGGVPEQKVILTQRAAAKALFQELPLNCNFTHSCNGSVGRVVSSLFSLEKHHDRKSVAEWGVDSERTRQHDLPENQEMACSAI